MNSRRNAKNSQTKRPGGPSGRGATTAAGEYDASDGEITVFLSYSREDERIYKMVRPFKEMLGHFIYAKSGREVKTFLDQDDINWGEIWMDRLEAEILGASVFIPLLSASYLDSDNCRMEFNRFQANASALGVKELLLPVLLVDAPAIFNQYSSDDVVRDASARQWELIEDAILSDPGSSAWKVTMSRLATRFVSSFEASEAKLATLGESDFTSLSISEADDDDDDDDSPALVELMESIGDNLAALTGHAQSLGPIIEDLGNAATSAGSASTAKTPQQMQQWSRRAAIAFEAPAIRLSESGEGMLNTTKALDVDIKRLRRLAIELLPANKEIAEGYNRMLIPLASVNSVVGQLEGLLTAMKPAELLAVPLRKALRPARRGLTRVNDSLSLIDTWKPVETQTDMPQ